MDSIYSDGRHYDALFPGHNRQAELDFYIRRVHQFGAKEVLELGCGTGQLTIPLAEKGVKITGLDLSKSMLDVAHKKADEREVEVNWVEGDCCDFSFEQRFGLIFFPANALLHLLDWRDLEKCLKQIKAHLSSGGVFVFEIFNPDLSLLTRAPDLRFPVGNYLDPDGRGMMTVTESHRYDSATQINHMDWHYQVEGEAEEMASLDLRMYFPQEINALLAYNGFALLAKYGNYDETPFTSSSIRQLIVCTPG